MATTKRKPTKVQAGLHLKKSSKGFSFHVHADNGNKLAAITGYNTRAAAVKSLLALNRALNKAFSTVTEEYTFTDHTVKKAAPKKKPVKR